MQADVLEKVMSLDYLLFDTLRPSRLVHLPNIDFTHQDGKIVYTREEQKPGNLLHNFEKMARNL